MNHCHSSRSIDSANCVRPNKASGLRYVWRRAKETSCCVAGFSSCVSFRAATEGNMLIYSYAGCTNVDRKLALLGIAPRWSTISPSGLERKSIYRERCSAGRPAARQSSMVNLHLDRGRGIHDRIAVASSVHIINRMRRWCVRKESRGVVQSILRPIY